MKRDELRIARGLDQGVTIGWCGADKKGDEREDEWRWVMMMMGGEDEVSGWWWWRSVVDEVRCGGVDGGRMECGGRTCPKLSTRRYYCCLMMHRCTRCSEGSSMLVLPVGCRGVAVPLTSSCGLACGTLLGFAAEVESGACPGVDPL